MFEELKFKRRPFRRPKEVYKRDINRSTNIVKEIENFNPDFSETFFDTWIQTIFLRYSSLVSLKADLEQFEIIHVKPGVKNNWRDEIDLYKYYDDVIINFVDFVDYTHTDEFDVICLKISTTSILKSDYNDEDEMKEQISDIFTIELEKTFSKDQKRDVKETFRTSNCPNCGGLNSFIAFGSCKYCGELICIYDNEWKIRRINLER